MRPSKCMIVGLVLATLLVTAGCGSRGKPVGQVQGTVAYHGKPVTQGVVNFYARSSGYGAIAKIEGGNYVLPEPLPVGEYAVYVTPPAPEPQLQPVKTAPKKQRDIPPKYRDPNTS